MAARTSIVPLRVSDARTVPARHADGHGRTRMVVIGGGLVRIVFRRDETVSADAGGRQSHVVHGDVGRLVHVPVILRHGLAVTAGGRDELQYVRVDGSDLHGGTVRRHVMRDAFIDRVIGSTASREDGRVVAVERDGHVRALPAGRGRDCRVATRHLFISVRTVGDARSLIP